MPPRVSELIDDPAHSGLLHGASVVGQAERGGIVTVGLWLDAHGRVVRARFRATSCPALVAYAEAACALAEAHRATTGLDEARIRAAVGGVHPIHHDRAEAVALAFERALRTRPSPPAAQERA